VAQAVYDVSSNSQGRRVRGVLIATGLILAGAAITAAIMVGLGFRRGPSDGTFVSAGGPCTLAGTTTARGGKVSICVLYSVSATGQVRVRLVRASYRSASGYDIPRFTVTLSNGATGNLDDRLFGPDDDADGARSYSSQFTAFRGPGADGSFALGETMVVTLTVASFAERPYRLALASVPLVLSRPAFPCPDPGTGGLGDSSIPVC
jgi:hypothetical protein